MVRFKFLHLRGYAHFPSAATRATRMWLAPGLKSCLHAVSGWLRLLHVCNVSSEFLKHTALEKVEQMDHCHFRMREGPTQSGNGS